MAHAKQIDGLSAITQPNGAKACLERFVKRLGFTIEEKHV
jgi:hypothetical protein